MARRDLAPGLDKPKRAQRLYQNHIASVAIVMGIEKAQYIQKCRDTKKEDFGLGSIGWNEKKFIPKSVCSISYVILGASTKCDE